LRPGFVLINDWFSYKIFPHRISRILFSIRKEKMRKWIYGAFIAVCLGCCTQTIALDSSDLLFHLSFEDGVKPEFARGSAEVARPPDELQRRIVEGVLGKGYLFAGKNSTIEFYTGGHGVRGCMEMYGPRANLFPDSGTICYWLKPLENMHDQRHDFVKFGLNGTYRDLYGVWYFAYAGKRKQMYNTKVPRGGWMHWAVTWQKDEMRSYLNGILWGKVAGMGVVDKAPERFIVAAQGSISVPRQKQDFEDDTIIDELQIFRRPLTDEEVRAVFERVHTAGVSYKGNSPTPREDRPERAYAGHLLAAARAATPITPDGDMSEWRDIPGHGGFIERRVGVLDDDPSVIYAASDGKKLYLGFYCPVDESIQKDPTHVKYPAGQFKASPFDRDGNVYEDDYVEFVLGSADGHEYRFALNGKGALLDSRDADRTWNAQCKWAGRSNFKQWTAELVIPLAEIGVKKVDTINFNVIRSWKWFKSSENSLCADERSQPAAGKLILDSGASASVSGLGEPWRGNLTVTGSIKGPPGQYLVKVHGKGHGIEFSEEKKVTVGKEIAPFKLARKFDRPADLAVVIDVVDARGRSILKRTFPFVYVAAASVELANYPGWGRLKVTVTPVEAKGASAAVSIIRNGKALMTSRIKKFHDPAETVTLDTRSLDVGDYEVLTQLYRDGSASGEDRRPYKKKPLPDWYNSKAGIIERPPVPWTDVVVEGNKVECLLKEITFDKTLFPAQIVSNGQKLLNGPVRIRMRRSGAEKVITAGDFRITKKTPRRADWVSTARVGGVRIEVSGYIEFDGFTWMDIKFAGGKVDHLALEIPLRRESATLQTLKGRGLMPDEPLATKGDGCWFGNEKAGIQYWWQDQRDWVLNNENITATPVSEEVLISIPLFQKTVYLGRPRTVTLGWAVTPSKPLRKDWRHIALHKGITYTTFDYTMVTPNYPKARQSRQEMLKGLESLKKSQKADIVMWYGFGPFMWVGAPEYAEWHHEWQVTSWQPVPPDPNSKEWGWVCHNSSGSNLYLDMLEKFVKEYPQRAIYVDCYFMMSCDNEAHGCGYVDEKGVRRMWVPLLATRRHYERLWNIIKTADPEYGWVRLHDLTPIMPVAAFCNDIWSGEGLITPIGNTPEKNYYRVVDLPYARVEYMGEHWGQLQAWLTELGVYAGFDPEKREQWYGKMVEPPKDGKRGKWVLPRMKDYEHVAGLALIHDMWMFGGNDLGISSVRVRKMQREMGWDDSLQFTGYWELGDALEMDGYVPEKVVCSLYYKPRGKDADGNQTGPWLFLAAMNNSDKDVTVTLKPNLKKYGLEELANGRLRDMYRATGLIYDMKSILNKGDPEPPYHVLKAQEIVFPMKNGAAKVTIPKRNFRALLLEQN